MKKSMVLLVVAVAAIGLVGGCIGAASAHTDPGKTITIGVGQEFTIALDSNPTTGYSWQESFDETALELIENTYEQGEAPEGIVGASGTEYFKFRALKTGETTITMAYQQPWAGGGVGETKAFIIDIK